MNQRATESTLTQEEINYFQQFYPQHAVTGKMMQFDGTPEKVLLKMKAGYRGWTPYGTIRDCGNHYTEAKYSSYNRIDKKTLEITKDVEDE